MQLLVSVRDPDEAAASVEAGADIIDVKDPSRGPLGRASSNTIAAICSAVDGRTPVSAALGEVGEARLISESEPSIDNCNLSFCKMGLSGLAGQASEQWKQSWLEARRLWDATPLVDQSTNWVAVGYADSVRADAPDIDSVLAAAKETDCTVLLIDTFRKDGRTTADWFSADALKKIKHQCQQSGLQFALAGQLTLEHLPFVQDVGPDILAVRGAVCSCLDRRQAVDGSKVADLKRAISST